MAKHPQNILLIVDPQNDFITGSLAVPHAEEAMDCLVEWISNHHKELKSIVVSRDWHPINHCSFEINGGIWPVHCVKDEYGAELYPSLQKLLNQLQKEGLPIHYLTKATEPDKEQYSAFESELPYYIQEAGILYVSGIAGDFCVRHTVADIRRHGYTGQLVYLHQTIAYINENAREEEN